MKRFIVLLTLIVFLLLIPQPALSATLEGRVLCENGKPVGEPVLIEIQGQRFSPVTDSNGRYSLALPPGRYIFRIRGKEFGVNIYPQNGPMDFYIPCR